MDTGRTAAIMDVVVGLRTPHSTTPPVLWLDVTGLDKGTGVAGACAGEAGCMQRRWGMCRRGGVCAEEAGCAQKRRGVCRRGGVCAEEAGLVSNAFVRVLKRLATSWERESDVPVFDGVSISIEPAGLILVPMGGCRLVARARHGVIASSGGSWCGPDARVSQTTVGRDKGKHSQDARCGWV